MEIKGSETGSKTGKLSILYSITVWVIGNVMVIIFFFLIGGYLMSPLINQMIFRIIISILILFLIVCITICFQLLIQGVDQKQKSFEEMEESKFDKDSEEFIRKRSLYGFLFKIPAQLAVLFFNILISLLFGYILFN
jgi:preprotein translocase subunit SecG